MVTVLLHVVSSWQDGSQGVVVQSSKWKKVWSYDEV